jgi:hypothetical protein
MLGGWMLPVSVNILFDFRIVPRMWYFLFSILSYCKTNYIYMYVRSMDVACFCDNSICFWNCCNYVVFFAFDFILYILLFIDFLFATSWWYVYISRFHISLPVCLDPSFCSYSSGCIYVIFVLFVVLFPQC